VVVGRVAHEATSFDKDALDRSMKMSLPTMGSNSDFKQWKRNFLNFLTLKAAYLIPQLAIRESGAWLDEHAQHYAYTLLFHAASDNKRADHAVKCVSAACPDCAISAWDILCERMDCRSFARSLSMSDNLILKQRLGQSLTDYVHFMRHTFDDYNETYELIDVLKPSTPPIWASSCCVAYLATDRSDMPSMASSTPSTQTTSCPPTK
jgi:hypothetical protein